ncbi:MAG: hypothetical protein JNL67_17575 [Planctomycetaceae bacterium]|nr:hypothetical protein [Planctomycetaceae bacterium]
MALVEINNTAANRSSPKAKLAFLIAFGITWISLQLAGQPIYAGIVVLQRYSYAGVYGFAGSGGVVLESDVESSLDQLSGGFGFGHNFNLHLTGSEPAATGAARAIGSLNASDMVTVGTNSLQITGSRTASGMVQWLAGNGNGISNLMQETRVRFSVSGENLNYSLTGSFDPGDTAGDLNTFSLYRPFTADQLFNISSAGTLHESGVLLAGRTYELRMRLNDNLSANSGSRGPFSDASGLNFNFQVSAVPEPSSFACLLAMSTIFLAARRRKI